MDVVLMDVQMPVLDGHDATRRIRTALGLVALPVIALTAGVTTGEHERAAAAGMNDVLGKPFEPSTLVACIRRYVTIDPEAAAAAAAAAASADAAQAAAQGWPAIEGIDAADASRRMGGDVNLFHAMLKRLLRDFADLAEPLANEPGGLDRSGRAPAQPQGQCRHAGRKVRRAAGRAGGAGLSSR
ncbi:response regulator [Piscinibacter aquaticus]|uniref:Response regulator n=1 Tax=Piscinibacter aquaticus TaxID=392597 RepID=A0A5C6TY34_9BURK|nr:response regulator [Piscinibacter aquaticus]